MKTEHRDSTSIQALQPTYSKGSVASERKRPTTVWRNQSLARISSRRRKSRRLAQASFTPTNRSRHSPKVCRRKTCSSGARKTVTPSCPHRPRRCQRSTFGRFSPPTSTRRRVGGMSTRSLLAMTRRRSDGSLSRRRLS